MGQYYRPIIFSEDGHKYTAHSHFYDDGQKLLEHSYVGNDFVNAITAYLFENKGRLAWVGDYSDDDNEHGYELGGGFIKDHDDFVENVYSILWGDGNEDSLTEVKDTPSEDWVDVVNSDYYFVNHTKGIYLSLREFVEKNKWHESYDWDGEHHEIDACLHPLPLLTAVGNGQGGGDYGHKLLNYDLVGSWAFDTIEIADTEPDGMEKVSYEFAKNV